MPGEIDGLRQDFRFGAAVQIHEFGITDGGLQRVRRRLRNRGRNLPAAKAATTPAWTLRSGRTRRRRASRRFARLAASSSRFTVCGLESRWTSRLRMEISGLRRPVLVRPDRSRLSCPDTLRCINTAFGAMFVFEGALAFPDLQTRENSGTS